MSLHHRFEATNPDGPDASKVRTSNWNDEHLFTGGAEGSLLWRATGIDGGADWLDDVAIGNVLLAGGVGAAPSYGKVGLATHVSGILPAANGGTGVAFFGVVGPTALRAYTFPDASTSVVTIADVGTVTNTMLAGSIADAKLLTVASAGKVSNSATTATSANTASAIVARDSSGNFSAGTITATLSGNASTATSAGSATLAAAATVLATPRAIYGNNFDGSAALGQTIAVGFGGTGIAAYAIGDIPYASGTTTLSKLAGVAVGSVVISGGVATAPAWSFNGALTLSSANGAVGLGTLSPNVQGASFPVTTISSGAARGVTRFDAYSTLELACASGATDSDDFQINEIDFVAPDYSISATKKKIASVEVYRSGTTAGDRGGYITFDTKRDGGVLSLALKLDNLQRALFSGQIQMTAGLVSAPSWTFAGTGNDTTGPYFTGSPATYHLAVGGTQVFNSTDTLAQFFTSVGFGAIGNAAYPLMARRDQVAAALNTHPMARFDNQQGATNYTSVYLSGANGGAYFGYLDSATIGTRHLALSATNNDDFIIDGNGKVGVNVASITSGAQFEVSGVTKTTSLGIGTAAPGTGNFALTGVNKLINFTQTNGGNGLPGQSSFGVLIGTNNGVSAGFPYGAGLLFATGDANFTTTPMKILAIIMPRATENPSSDTRGGTAMDFFTSPNNPGAAPSPSLRMTIDQSGNVGIGTNAPNAAALLEMVSTTKGLLSPRMTTTQRDAIASVPEGLVIYNLTTHKLNLFTTAWEAVTSA